MANQTVPAVLKPRELTDLLRTQSEVRLLDARTPGEFEAVHIRGAYNVPLDTLGEHSEEIRSHVAEPVVLICQSGTRARKAEQALKQIGMPNLHVLDGGMNAWVTAGQPAERGRGRLSLERQVRIIAGGLAATGGVLATVANPIFGLVAAFVGGGLVFAGVTDSCAMGGLLSRLPYNRPASTDVADAVRALKTGSAPANTSRAGDVAGPVRPACAS